MLEDALKNTRNIHRLILTISFVTIVFSLSIDHPRDKEEQLEALSKLGAVPFIDYKDFAEKAVNDFEESTLQILVDQINTRLKQENYTLFNTHHIGEAFSKNVQFN